MDKRIFMIARLFSLGTLLFLPSKAFAELKICNQTPYNVQLVIFGGIGNDIAGKGWFNLAHGECGSYWSGDISLHTFYLHAEADDDLADWVSEGRVIWGDRLTQVCVPNGPFDNAEMSYITNPFVLSGIGPSCADGWGIARVHRIKTAGRSGENFQWNIELAEFPHSDNFSGNDWRRVLQGRKDYEDTILKQTRRFPFRVGASFTGSDNLIIEKIHSGLPAEALGLKPGDVIYSVGDKEVFTPFEFVDEINRYGFEFGFGKAVQITVARDSWLMDGWIDLEYYHELDPRINDAESSEATLAAAWDSAWLGYGSLIRCGGEALLSDSWNWLFSDDATFSEAQRIGECTALHEAYLDRLELMYPDEYWNGDLGGAFFGGLRVLPKAWFRLGTRQAARLIGSRAVARIVVQASTDAADSFLTVIGQSSADQSFDDVFDDAVRAGKIGGGFSAVIHGVTK